jgi:phosphoribosylformylglycinamidine synthase
MKQKYKDSEVISPGTVIISAAGHCNDIRKTVVPVFKKDAGSIYYINFSQDDFKLGGSSFGQILNIVGSHTPTITDDAFFKNAFNTVQDLIKQDLIVAGHDVASGGLITTLLELCFADQDLAANIDLTNLAEADAIKVLFSENAGIVFQAKDNSVETILKSNNIQFNTIGSVVSGNTMTVTNHSEEFSFDIPKLRDIWYKTSYLHDQRQSGGERAAERYRNYKNQPLQFKFPEHFTGKLPSIDSSKPRPKAAIIREKGSNSEREMANAMYLAGFDVKDVHMTDLISGREDLKDIKFIAAVGGFSNSDVLGSAKGWAGAFLYNDKANKALKDFFNREDTLSLGVCNGCQLFIELGLINPEDAQKPSMLHNKSGKFECTFTSVTIQKNNSVMLSNFEGSTLGIWAAHGEGKFSFPNQESHYNIVGKYGYEGYPANPNGSHFNAAMLTDKSGRHLVMMPHLERSTFSWNWAHYPNTRKDEASPWLDAFINAKNWVEKN